MGSCRSGGARLGLVGVENLPEKPQAPSQGLAPVLDRTFQFRVCELIWSDLLYTEKDAVVDIGAFWAIQWVVDMVGLFSVVVG